MTLPQDIADKLSEAQRRAFRHTSRDNPVLYGRPRTLRSLADAGLCWPPKSWEITRTEVLARPLGLEVRSILQSKEPRR